MRPWYKYNLQENQTGDASPARVDIDRSFFDHQKAMGGYDSDAAYQTKESFFKKYLWDYHAGRLAFYDAFLKKHLNKNSKILSIASGRCANEMQLLDHGYDITCSDLDYFTAYPQTKELFPSMQFMKVDVLQGPSKERFDAVICLSLIYIFDDKELARFFQNINQSLTPGGRLLLDFVGSPDNFLSWGLHDVLLKAEVYLKRTVLFLLGRGWRRVIKKKHGYRRTDQEVIDLARANGFEWVSQENGAFLVDFERSSILGRLVKWNPIVAKVFSFFGQSIPYVRMGDFKKST